MDIKIIHDQEKSRFVTVIKEQECYVNYRKPDDKTLDLYLTYVAPDLRGQNIAAKLVKTALEYTEKNNYKIIPTCPYVQHFINKNPQYQRLIFAV